jgi:hypothetical protein
MKKFSMIGAGPIRSNRYGSQHYTARLPNGARLLSRWGRKWVRAVAERRPVLSVRLTPLDLKLPCVETGLGKSKSSHLVFLFGKDCKNWNLAPTNS